MSKSKFLLEFLLFHRVNNDFQILLVQITEEEWLQDSSFNSMNLLLRLLDDSGVEIILVIEHSIDFRRNATSRHAESGFGLGNINFDNFLRDVFIIITFLTLLWLGVFVGVLRI